MASIFTFDPDPPRVASPWSTPGTSTPEQGGGRATNDLPRGDRLARGSPLGRIQSPPDFSLTKLDAEPQEGPTEYKLHLLLRPRRSFTSTTTANRISGSSNRSSSFGEAHRKSSGLRLSSTPPLASSSQSRQHRLEQLTTQLLWRLQQSSPYQVSASNNLILPAFPQIVGGVGVSQHVGRVLPGLEESKGALYELGVADDGTFVGLAQDELDESLHNLRAMAATLGCSIELLRKVPVGECEWFEDVGSVTKLSSMLRKGTLWVAEAFVKPNLGGASINSTGSTKSPFKDIDQSSTEQLRITLTGATMSGKSSLLGSLSNATLDNGRGKSRLSLLKHRHEIASGMTSSVTQELLGYCKGEPLGSSPSPIRIVNSASADVASWFDIHSLCEGGRLVFFSDSAGHPRYRRTTVRGLVGWAPHWTLLCVPADNAEDTSGMSGSTPPLKDLLGCGTADVDLSEAHLRICLDLDLPLVIAITKLDLASKYGLRQLLAKLLTTLKAVGRKPVIVPDSPGPSVDSESLLIDTDDLLAVQKVFSPPATGHQVVPIVLTSAVSGTGIGKLHALLSQLPIPLPPLRPSATSAAAGIPSGPLFHVEDIYGDKSNTGNEEALIVVSGYLRYGEIRIGDEMTIGPYASGPFPEDIESSPNLRPRDMFPTSRSFPGAMSNTTPLEVHHSTKAEEWRRVKVRSLRNLRLPVHSLHADQVGTIGIQALSTQISSPALNRVRKGMVLTSSTPASSRSVEAQFTGLGIRTLTVGSMVVAYFASVRATAKVIYMAVGDDPIEADDADEDAFQFDFGSGDEGLEAEIQTPINPNVTTIVRFRFMASREFVEPGRQILILPGGGPGLSGGNVRGEKGLAGLDGFVGKVLQGLSE
ncbi:hypothetical protein NA57DRAFT_42566 [Rhizodiscina lignyota]|uniref:Tr-type G domain-containing protein n=1 Tax=Rhizodiscina lignyota TaxID=1504668 RepID=A0A9P4IEL5_9PEZI|nr:hypothetical protein NA57DRAFT_42566 [Rhizodiscina lignyota]